MNELEFRLCLKIDVQVLDIWIEQGWLLPETTQEGRRFGEVDVARARLILDLIDTMGVNEAGVDVVMDLVDQVHSLRGALRDLLTAIGTQNDEVQQRILSEAERLGQGHGS